jgi:hypothetical protein
MATNDEIIPIEDALKEIRDVDTVYYVNASAYKLVLLNSASEAMDTLEKAHVNNSSICSSLKYSALKDR